MKAAELNETHLGSAVKVHDVLGEQYSGTLSGIIQYRDTTHVRLAPRMVVVLSKTADVEIEVRS